ncbi:MAG: anaerobic glycerol-3-phosphate dehydrogenase subunit GlpA [Acidimicrobiales bacterium]
MTRLTTEVLVIGGGASGAGVLRDAAMRGFAAILVERGDLATGTTGRFHGLLHSGARYVVKDPLAAVECIHENRVLRRIAADCIEDTGGLFVTTPLDDPAYAEPFVAGCHACGVPVEEIPAGEALRREPRLNPLVSRAFVVPDAAVDAWKTVWATVRSAQEHGARVLPYHELTALRRSNGTVVGAVVRDHRAGEDVDIDADFVVSAAGAWSGRVAALAGCDLHMMPGKGIMIAMNHRLVNTVVNRCTMPADGDILVPIRTVSVIGTTDVHVDDPDEWDISPAEVQEMLEAGENLVPGFRRGRALRVWGGVRPLYQTKAVADDREITRAHTVIDHAEHDGVGRFVTITGGKFATYRLMAEETVDAVCRQLGVERTCRTADEPLPESEAARYYWLGGRLEHREETRHDDQLICECELVPRRQLEEAMRRRHTTSLDDIRRTVRLGMGPCQGGFCIYRATGILHGLERLSGPAAGRSLREFLQERWKGVQPILYGDQLRQARYDDWVFQGILDVAHTPTEPATP